MVGFFWRSVWMILILMRFLMYICNTVFGSIFMHKIAHVTLAFAPFCIFLYTDISTSEHGIMASSLKEKKKKTDFNFVLMFPLYALVV